jgi:hypothetical protein
MSKTKITVPFVYFILGIFSLNALAQNVTIELGPDEIGINETFSIKATLSNDKIKSYDEFPEIPGFQKQGISQSSSMNIINGQVSSTNSIIQYYKPTRKGEFNLEAFSVKINGTSYSSAGKKISVIDSRPAQRQSGIYDPFDDLFGQRNREEPEFIEVEDDAFFASSVDKEEVYVGEGL